MDVLDGSPAPRYTWCKSEENRLLPNRVSPKREHAKYGDDHWKWLISGGLFSGANETREFIIGSLGATRKGGVETGTTQEWHLL